MAEAPITAEPRTGFQTTLGYELVDWREGHAVVKVDLDARHLNRSDVVHGGLAATLIDTACGHAGCYCTVPGNLRKAVTLTLTANYLGQARDGRLIATARVVGGGRKIFFAEAEIRDQAGALIATGGGTFRYRSGSEFPEGQPPA